MLEVFRFSLAHNLNRLLRLIRKLVFDRWLVVSSFLFFVWLAAACWTAVNFIAGHEFRIEIDPIREVVILREVSRSGIYPVTPLPHETSKTLLPETRYSRRCLDLKTGKVLINDQLRNLSVWQRRNVTEIHSESSSFFVDDKKVWPIAGSRKNQIPVFFDGCYYLRSAKQYELMFEDGSVRPLKLRPLPTNTNRRLQVSENILMVSDFLGVQVFSCTDQNELVPIFEDSQIELTSYFNSEILLVRGDGKVFRIDAVSGQLSSAEPLPDSLLLDGENFNAVFETRGSFGAFALLRLASESNPNDIRMRWWNLHSRRIVVLPSKSTRTNQTLGERQFLFKTSLGDYETGSLSCYDILTGDILWRENNIDSVPLTKARFKSSKQEVFTANGNLGLTAKIRDYDSGKIKREFTPFKNAVWILPLLIVTYSYVILFWVKQLHRVGISFLFTLACIALVPMGLALLHACHWRVAMPVLPTWEYLLGTNFACLAAVLCFLSHITASKIRLLAIVIACLSIELLFVWQIAMQMSPPILFLLAHAVFILILVTMLLMAAAIKRLCRAFTRLNATPNADSAANAPNWSWSVKDGMWLTISVALFSWALRPVVQSESVKLRGLTEYLIEPAVFALCTGAGVLTILWCSHRSTWGLRGIPWVVLSVSAMVLAIDASIGFGTGHSIFPWHATPKIPAIDCLSRRLWFSTALQFTIFATTWNFMQQSTRITGYARDASIVNGLGLPSMSPNANSVSDKKREIHVF